MNKKLHLTAASILISIAITIPAFAAEWRQDTTGWWYAETDGSYPVSQWRQIEGIWYYFDNAGYMHTGWLQEGSDWYYFDASGRMLSNEARTIDGVSYSFGADGKMLYDNGAQAVPVTKDQMNQWFYATYAIIANSTSWNEDYFKSSFGTWQFEAKYRLQLAWGITDKSSAESIIQSLKANGDRNGSAWDYSRAMQVIREAYLAGYYTETEQLDRMLTVALAIQETYSSWDEMAESYLSGLRRWSGSEAEYDSRKQIYESLKMYTTYYQIDWNLTLQKVW